MGQGRIWIKHIVFPCVPLLYMFLFAGCHAQGVVSRVSSLSGSSSVLGSEQTKETRDKESAAHPYSLFPSSLAQPCFFPLLLLLLYVPNLQACLSSYLKTSRSVSLRTHNFFYFIVWSTFSFLLFSLSLLLFPLSSLFRPLPTKASIFF